MAIRKIAGITFACALSGCVGPPDFDTPRPLTVQQLVHHILCEVYNSTKAKQPKGFEKWAGVANLYIQVDDNKSLTPSITYINPLAAVASFMFGGNAALGEMRQRLYTENFPIHFDKLTPEKFKNCAKAERDEFNLNGDLGIKEVFEMGLETFTASHETENESSKGETDLTASLTDDSNKLSFGQTIQFIVTKSVTALGPTWTLRHFIGPSGLVNISRMDTHKLIISFAPPTAEPAFAPFALTPAETPAEANAAANNLNMLLQGTLSTIRAAPLE
jgi:hypothetical protein